MNVTALLTSAVVVAVVVLALLIADAVLAVVELRRVRPAAAGEPAPQDARHPGRVRELRWTVVVTAAIAVLVAFGADSAARFVWRDDRPVTGALILLGVTALTVVVGVAAVALLVRRESPSYASIRRELRDRSNAPIAADELLEFEQRLDRADHARARGSHGSSLVPVTVARVGGVAALLALTLLVGLMFGPGGDSGLAVALFSVAALLGIAAFSVTLRARALESAALQTVLDAQRAEVIALLERARIPARGRIPGLGNRVARALAILRERQK